VEATNNAHQDWLVEQVRVTAFRYPGVAVDAKSQWSVFSKDPPEEISEKPGVQTTRLEGSFGSGRLVLSIDPVRIDWNLVPLSSPETLAADVFPTIGGGPDAIVAFLGAGAVWLSSEDCPRLLRLAFGCVFIRTFEERVKAYEFLAGKLPAIDIDTKNSSDLLYQINRPKPSTVVDGLKLNRLSKWGVLRARVVLQSGTSEPVKYPPIGERFATRLEIDLNTAAERDEDLPRKLQAALLDELVKEGNEIAGKGDV
jgi:hypothetical protein